MSFRPGLAAAILGVAAAIPDRQAILSVYADLSRAMGWVELMKPLFVIGVPAEMRDLMEVPRCISEAEQLRAGMSSESARWSDDARDVQQRASIFRDRITGAARLVAGLPVLFAEPTANRRLSSEAAFDKGQLVSILEAAASLIAAIHDWSEKWRALAPTPPPRAGIAYLNQSKDPEAATLLSKISPTELGDWLFDVSHTLDVCQEILETLGDLGNVYAMRVAGALRMFDKAEAVPPGMAAFLAASGRVDAWSQRIWHLRLRQPISHLQLGVIHEQLEELVSNVEILASVAQSRSKGVASWFGILSPNSGPTREYRKLGQEIERGLEKLRRLVAASMRDASAKFVHTA